MPSLNGSSRPRRLFPTAQSAIDSQFPCLAQRSCASRGKESSNGRTTTTKAHRDHPKFPPRPRQNNISFFTQPRSGLVLQSRETTAQQVCGPMTNQDERPSPRLAKRRGITKFSAKRMPSLNSLKTGGTLRLVSQPTPGLFPALDGVAAFLPDAALGRVDDIIDNPHGFA